MHSLNKSILGFSVLLLCGMIFAACASKPPVYIPPPSGSRAQLPDWFTNPETAGYPRNTYTSANGEGRTAEDAQFNARANLLGIFGMKLADESVIAEMFSQTTTNNVTNWNETVTSDRRISTSAEGILAGATIEENAQVGQTFYALAVMENARARRVYGEIIAQLQRNITDLLNIPNINTIDGFTRTRIAAEIAKDIEACVRVLNHVGGTVPAGLKTESQYLTDADNILRNIPVSVNIRKNPANVDSADRVQGAFTRALTEIGFRTGTANAPYALDVSLTLTEAPAQGANIFFRYELSANFRDTRTNAVIARFNIADREGHTSVVNAHNRVFTRIEERVIGNPARNVDGEFKTMLLQTFSSLTPGR